MPAPATVSEFLDLVQRSGLLDQNKFDVYLEKLRATSGMPQRPDYLAGYLVRDGFLTHFQAEQILLGKWRRFTIGKYKVLERLGSGRYGSVYLCWHPTVRRRVALKVLPTAYADDPASLERFYREARAFAAVHHPNIVRAYDIDQDEKLHFLVMEYVDGSSLQEIVKRSGALDAVRAAHYIRQAALGLQHAHESGLVRVEIKPSKTFVDRSGTIKIVDLGPCRFGHNEDHVPGTADDLAPEQALDSHALDIRADVYSLGAAFSFCLTGKYPSRRPKPLPWMLYGVPVELAAVVDRVMAQDPGQRYATPIQVAQALDPWTQTPIAPPSESEMPHLSPAAREPEADR
jgi:eukaryotic-like serine/threonine-protein kinase